MTVTIPDWAGISEADAMALEPMGRPADANADDDIDIYGPIKLTATGELFKDRENKSYPISAVALENQRRLRFFDGDRDRYVQILGRFKKTDAGLVAKTSSPQLGTITLSKLELSDAPLFVPKAMALTITMPQFIAYLRGEDWQKAK